MKRWLVTMATALLMLSGCTQPKSNPTPPREAPLTPTPAAPVDYYNTGLDAGHQPVLPLTANACRATATGSLQLEVSEVRWRPHPLAPDKFWAPSAVITACNGALTKSPEQSLTLLKADGLPLGPFYLLPGLDPGQALGPVRLYANSGVTAGAGAFWQQEGQLWPSLTLEAAGRSYPVRRSLDPTGPEAPGGGAPPASPSLAQLRTLALDAVTFSPDGQRQVELFLYDPEVRYTLTDFPSCASLTGQVDADGQHWSFWASIDGGTPFPAGEAGAYGFPGGRALSKEITAVAGTTYVYLEQYAGCSNTMITEVFAFDHATNTVWRPQMKLETGQTLGATGRVDADGKLHFNFYSNATADFGYHRITYKWDAQDRLWVTETHERTKP